MLYENANQELFLQLLFKKKSLSYFKNMTINTIVINKNITEFRRIMCLKLRSYFNLTSVRFLYAEWRYYLKSDNFHNFFEIIL